VQLVLSSLRDVELTHPFIERFRAHPAFALPGRELTTEAEVHPLYCRASRSSVQRWGAMFYCRAPSRAHAQQWHVYGIDVGVTQRRALLTRAALCELLVLRLMRSLGANGVRYPLHHATCVVSRRHFLVSKNLADGLFQEGQRLCEQQRFSDAAKSWGQAALLQHAASHAFLSTMLFEGRPGVAVDEKRAFAFAAAGAVLSCAHSKGALGRCLIAGEVARWFRLAAVQGHADAQFNLGHMFENGQGVTQDRAEAARWYRMAAAQGHAVAAEAVRRFGA
jgi:TPR repeat protein